jgi:SAM-dependent methyltransferase
MVESEFDGFAGKYDEALERGISVSGEDKDFFAAGRVERLQRTLRLLGVKPSRILDFGCGTGSAIPHLLTISDSVKGVDVSRASLEIARKSFHGDQRVDLEWLGDFPEEGVFDLAFCNGVFHHIPPDERAKAVETVRRSLKPDGLFAFWENNPWNPGTRIVMSRIPFDRDAIPLSPPEARDLLNSGGFEILGQEFHFYFPRCLSAFRFLEGILRRIPLGAQYQIIGRKQVISV